MNFIHASDFHLGYAQYGILERFKYYARAFISSINSYTSSAYYYKASS